MCDVIIDVIENSKVYFQLQFMANISNFFLALFSRLENSSRLLLSHDLLIFSRWCLKFLIVMHIFQRMKNPKFMVGF